MNRFCIADTKLEVFSDNKEILSSINDFSSPYSGEPELIIDISGREAIGECEGKVLISDNQIKWITKNEYITAVNLLRNNTRDIISTLEADNAWSRVSIAYLKNETEDEYPSVTPLINISFNNALLMHRGIVIHAAAIAWEGKGIIFSAPSGTGKSTQANLWRTYMGAEVLNGDRPALRVVDNVTHVYGTPWSGSSPDFTNNKAPLSAIIVLEQSETNNIIRLKKQEAAAMLLPRCFLPYYKAELMDRAIANLDEIIENIPVFLLKCRPDLEAVELVKQCVK